MNDQDRITITKCLPELVQNIQLTEHFTRLLIEKKVFSRAMIQDILATENKERTLCCDLQRRGPESYKKFISALAETGQHHIIAILAQKRSQLGFAPHDNIPQSQLTEESRITSNNTNSRAQEYQRKVLSPPSYPEDVPSSPSYPGNVPSSPVTAVTDALPLTTYETMEIVVKPALEDKGSGKEVYPNNFKTPRGLALIINFKHFTNMPTREGSERDVIQLDKLLQALGYKVTVRSDITKKETFSEIGYFSKDEAHLDADSTIIAIMSHGKPGALTEGTLIYASDGQQIPSEEILRRFNNIDCPNLRGKPKIFLFQFCRGELRDNGIPQDCRRVVADGKVISEPETSLDRSFDDMLIAYSTIPGHVSYREEDEGTWFVKAICLIFMNFACVMHVHALLLQVDKLIQSWTASFKGKYSKQTTEISSRGFNKKFFFNPGLKPISSQNPK